MTKQQKVVSGVVVAILLLSVGWVLLPFRFADAVDCGPPLLGAEPGEYVETGQGFINPERDCHNKAKSRLTVAATASLLAVVVGVVSLTVKPQSAECLNGDHDACSQWWPAELGPTGEEFSCQCTCHTG
ncbi:MAG TPA: hypothetical protein VHG90_13260 [Acidimicrobiales bacterium]|nr:hypothetical protein [Acidimicrobiales bacterium]